MNEFNLDNLKWPKDLRLREEHREILAQGVTAWNHWRDLNLHVIPDLHQLDFRGMSLQGINLSGANLRGTDLTGANLSFASLREACRHAHDTLYNLLASLSVNLDKAILSHADLARVVFPDASFLEANLENVKGTNAYLKGAKFDRANLMGSDISGANFTDSSLVGANLSRTKCEGARFRRANLTKATLDKAIMCACTLKGANLEDASLRYANLARADLTEARFIRSDLTGALIDEAIVYDTVFALIKGLPRQPSKSLRSSHFSGEDISPNAMSELLRNSAALSARNGVPSVMILGNVKGDINMSKLEQNYKGDRGIQVQGSNARDIGVTQGQQSSSVVKLLLRLW